MRPKVPIFVGGSASGGGIDGGGAIVEVTLVTSGVLGVPTGDGGRNGSLILCNSGVRGSTAKLLKPLMKESVYSEGDPGG